MQSKTEQIVGNVLSGIIILVIIWSFFFTIFSFLFKDKPNIGLYGNRGNFYIYDDY